MDPGSCDSEEGQADPIFSILETMESGECHNALNVQGLYEVQLQFNDSEASTKIHEAIESMNYQVESSEEAPDGWNMDEMITADKIDEAGHIDLKKVKLDA